MGKRRVVGLRALVEDQGKGNMDYKMEGHYIKCWDHMMRMHHH